MKAKTITIEQMNNKLKELQISDFAQFIDVLDAIGSYNTIEEVKVDIAIRKRLLKESIERMEKKVE